MENATDDKRSLKVRKVDVLTDYNDGETQPSVTLTTFALAAEDKFLVHS